MEAEGQPAQTHRLRSLHRTGTISGVPEPAIDTFHMTLKPYRPSGDPPGSSRNLDPAETGMLGGDRGRLIRPPGAPGDFWGQSERAKQLKYTSYEPWMVPWGSGGRRQCFAAHPSFGALRPKSVLKGVRGPSRRVRSPGRIGTNPGAPDIYMKQTTRSKI